ncbi:MAG: hypothetical protein K6F37_07305 [Lachnospiraceae bacterium]|nr:hypothetical protein [Lachnospiraceae bacterium]
MTTTVAFWIIIICWLVIRSCKQKRLNEERKDANKRMATAEKRAERNLNKKTEPKPSVFTQYKKPSYTKAKPQKKTYSYTQTQTKTQAAKSKPIEITDSPSSNPEDLIAQGDILEKANAEVNKQHTEDHDKVLVNQMRDVTADSFAFDNSPEGAEERMKKVRDLMIMGYGGHLEFQRDFIAEGVEMLNKYTGSML